MRKLRVKCIEVGCFLYVDFLNKNKKTKPSKIEKIKLEGVTKADSIDTFSRKMSILKTQKKKKKTTSK